MKTAKPFVKWVGGKSQLLDDIRKFYPEKIIKYCEPFVGGGAVLFDVLRNRLPKEVLINDINKELINTYLQVKNNCRELIAELSEFQETYKKFSQEERKNMFIEKRERFNALKINDSNAFDIEKAALFIFLNKTCFNGLYRVNSKGLFNVPFNNAKNPPICDIENLSVCSVMLQNVEIRVGDYSLCKDFIDNQTFAYFDPPYRPLTQTAAFTSYNETEFTDTQQIELSKFISDVSANAAKFLLSNSDPKNADENDKFFDDLYSKFNMERIYASRAINSKGTGRGKITELLISNIMIDKEFAMTAEELFKTPFYQQVFAEEIGDPAVDSYAKTKLTKDLAQTKNYKKDTYYHANGGTGSCGVGKGLYLGKDAMALHNFYNGEGEFGDEIVEYQGHPKFLDLTIDEDFENFKAEAIQKYGKDSERSCFNKLTLEKGYDGIRYYDVCTTGEEFVLYNTDKVKKIVKRKVKSK